MIPIGHMAWAFCPACVMIVQPRSSGARESRQAGTPLVLGEALRMPSSVLVRPWLCRLAVGLGDGTGVGLRGPEGSNQGLMD